MDSYNTTETRKDKTIVEELAKDSRYQALKQRAIELLGKLNITYDKLKILHDELWGPFAPEDSDQLQPKSDGIMGDTRGVLESCAEVLKEIDEVVAELRK